MTFADIHKDIRISGSGAIREYTQAHWPLFCVALGLFALGLVIGRRD